MAVGHLISVDEVRTTPRGRQASYDDELLALLGDMSPGQAAALEGLATPDKTKRSAVSANIRKHFRAAHGEDVKCRIEYSPEGVPQVKFAE